MLNKYTIPLPDGRTVEKTTPEWVVHTWAVIGLLKLRQLLPPLNPDDKAEEPRYRRFEQWTLLATSERESNAQRMADEPVYPSATLETRVIPITAVPCAGVQSEGLAAYHAARKAITDPTSTRITLPPDLYPVGGIKKLDLPGITVVSADTGEVMAVLPPALTEIRVNDGLLASLKHIPLADSNYVLPETQPDGSTRLIELQGVTFQNMTTTFEPGDDLEPVDFTEL